MTDVATGPGPVASDFVSLSSACAPSSLLRLVFAAVAFVAGVLRPGDQCDRGSSCRASRTSDSRSSAELVRRGGKGRRLAIAGFRGPGRRAVPDVDHVPHRGVLSPFQLFIYVHVIAISLLASYRTGLKVAVWDTLLLVAVVNARGAGTLAVSPTMFGGSIRSRHGALGDHDRRRCGAWRSRPPRCPP